VQKQPNKDGKVLTTGKRRKGRHKTFLLLLCSVAWLRGAASYTVIQAIPNTGTIAHQWGHSMPNYSQNGKFRCRKVYRICQRRCNILFYQVQWASSYV